MLSNEFRSVLRCNVFNRWSAPACVLYKLGFGSQLARHSPQTGYCILMEANQSCKMIPMTTLLFQQKYWSRVVRNMVDPLWTNTVDQTWEILHEEKCFGFLFCLISIPNGVGVGVLMCKHLSTTLAIKTTPTWLLQQEYWSQMVRNMINPLWTNTADHIWEILFIFCFDLVPKWCERLRYEGGRSWGVKAFRPRFQFVQTGCEGSSTGPGHTQRKQTKKDKENLKTFQFWNILNFGLRTPRWN